MMMSVYNKLTMKSLYKKLTMMSPYKKLTMASLYKKLIQVKLSTTTLAGLALLFSLNAFGLSLADAKNQGLVGEQASGYLGVVGQSSSAVNALVRDINAKRRSAYKDIASKNQTPLGEIEKLAGNKAMQKTPSGQYIKQGEAWVKVR